MYSNIYVFIYLFIKQQIWMSALAASTISISTVQFNRQKEHYFLTKPDYFIKQLVIFLSMSDS